MARKGISNFANQVTKEAIKEHNKKLKEMQKQEKQLKKELEKKEKEEYRKNRYKEVEKLNVGIDNHISSLENIIDSNISDYNNISIEKFINNGIKKLKLPQELLIEHSKPIKPNIRKANVFEKLFKSYKLKYNTYVNEIETNYKNEYKLYEAKELRRTNGLESLKKEHELKANEILYNKIGLYINGDIGIITSYKKYLLNKSKYTFEFNRAIDTGYCKLNKILVIDYLLPKKDIISKVLSYEYKPKLDEIREVHRKQKDINSIYNDVIYSIVLRSIDEVFKSDKYSTIESIVFNGYIEDIDLATGQDIKPYIISTMIDKNSFRNMDITRVDKMKCLKECMQGRININSNLEFKSIIPIYKYDYFNKSVISSDSINLLKVDPYELETLVCTLFRNMGYEVEETTRSHDGGIDCSLYHKDPIVGGKVIGQVKRYKGNIDIPKLREFESVLRNSDAMKGIFISTSNFSPQCKQFAGDNNITLINGSSLVKYFNDYGINSYIQN